MKGENKERLRDTIFARAHERPAFNSTAVLSATLAGLKFGASCCLRFRGEASTEDVILCLQVYCIGLVNVRGVEGSACTRRTSVRALQPWRRIKIGPAHNPLGSKSLVGLKKLNRPVCVFRGKVVQ